MKYETDFSLTLAARLEGQGSNGRIASYNFVTGCFTAAESHVFADRKGIRASTVRTFHSPDVS
jgi:hypothetical protein